jgi:hypothetical protein
VLESTNSGRLYVLVDHVKANPNNAFFRPPTGTMLSKVKVPLLLVVTPHVIYIVLKHGGVSCIPMQLYTAIKDLIQVDNLDTSKWALVLNWCHVAQHFNATDTTSSTIAISFTAIMTEDKSFQAFCAAWLDFNLEPCLPTTTGSTERRKNTNTNTHLLGRCQCASQQYGTLHQHQPSVYHPTQHHQATQRATATPRTKLQW